ncbi:hypothetical protein APY03_7693 [Variovorax sp. WDL1]|nr:hypothetical protein APY03_7693 [Variovorax sp. WDL1]
MMASLPVDRIAGLLRCMLLVLACRALKERPPPALSDPPMMRLQAPALLGGHPAFHRCRSGQHARSELERK